MVQRVVIGAMVHGYENGERLELNPGDVIDTDDLGLDEEEVAKLDASGAFRARRDVDTAVQDDNVTENRSGRARNARDRRALQDKPKSKYENADDL